MTLDRDLFTTYCEDTMTNDDIQPNDYPVAPTLVLPTEPITSCSFLIAIAADEDVTVEIYWNGRQVTRECVNNLPGPVGTIKPAYHQGNRRYEANACLCGITNGDKIRFVICPVDPSHPCTTVTRTVNHNGSCPPCVTKCDDIEAVVQEIRTAVTQRVVKELTEAVKKISGGSKKPEAAPPANVPDRTTKPRRGRRRRK